MIAYQVYSLVVRANAESMSCELHPQYKKTICVSRSFTLVVHELRSSEVNYSASAQSR